jgi:hypothetical protein
MAMKTVESPDEKFIRQVRKATDRAFATLAGIQALLQKVMQSGWVAQRQ